MQTLIISILMILFFNNLLMAQGSWYFDSPGKMKDFHFISDQTLIAVGDGIWKSTDGGDSWKGVYPGFDFEFESMLNGVEFANSQIGYAAGKKSTVIKTTDGGNTWVKLEHQLLSPSNHFVFLKVLDQDNILLFADMYGSFSGLAIYKSTDGGGSFNYIFGKSGEIFHDVDFIDGQTGWATGSNRAIYKTTDGGNNWSTSFLPEEIGDVRVYSVSFADSQNGLVTASDTLKLFRTTNGGNSWQLINLDYQWNSYSIKYFADGSAFMLNNDLKLLKSTNHGESWDEVNSIRFMYAGTKIKFKDRARGIIYGGFAPSSNFTISSDSGSTWVNYSKGGFYKFALYTGSYFYAPLLVPVQNLAHGFLLLKKNPGSNWYSEESVLNWGVFPALDHINPINPDFLFGIITARADSFAQITRVITRSTDAGASWNHLQTERLLSAHFFLNGKTFWYATSSGKIFKSNDSGVTINEQVTGITSRINHIFFLDENTGWASGNSGVLIKTTNGGNDWQTIQIPGFSTANLGTINFYDENRGFMLAISESVSKVLQTTNGGSSWVDNTPQGLSLYQVTAPLVLRNNSEVYVLGQFPNYIYFSDLAGEQWYGTQLPSNIWLYGLQVINRDNILISAEGAILKVTKGFITSVKEVSGEIPLNNFNLEQNYPNPFNPETKIRYSIPSNISLIHVKLILYTIQGNEVGILVDEVQNSGNYEVSFKADGIPSGVYFYKIQAGAFEQTKKMILLK
ncbi:MAG: T9SS type A sorting domain-containing protein [Ignavibacteriaceae bacterium]|nr:T9SS type A sorting domain-containing protein [Ignavibacteriaceae bacterium]